MRIANSTKTYAPTFRGIIFIERFKMSTLNTKGMTYNVLKQQNPIFKNPTLLTVCVCISTCLIFYVLFPIIEMIIPIKNSGDLIPKNLNNSTKFIISVVASFAIMFLIKIKPRLYLWTARQNSEHFTISKSEILANILSDNCHFAGYVYRPINNENIHKTCIKIPLTNIEYDKIFAHLRNNREHEEKCMNPDVTIKE